MPYTEIERLSAITKVHRKVGSCMEIDKIARILVRTLAELTKCDACAFMFIDGGEVKILADMGFELNFSQLELNADLPMIKGIIEDNKPLIIGDLPESQYYGCLPEGCLMRSLICLPITVDDTVKAILHIDSLKPNAFLSEDIDFAKLIAREASLAVERALIFSKVVDMSIKDELTGCYNRRKLDLDLEARFAEAKLCKSVLSCFMIDVDYFKQFNDTYGHSRGDECLKKIAGLIQANLRPEDAAYRYGGEEFTVLMSYDSSSPLAIAERLRTAVSNSSLPGDGAGKVTISIGLATYPDVAKTSSELLKIADSRLYKAKENGRNRVCAE